ncbi:glycosyltransferase [Methylobacterium sp. J-090]|uniref:glycosyltransferase n=1 Tax=Methylobacterium sp. J-090 TaxID=2836666 RepID=UPI001FBA1C75|nr:glycosyltransferase [Methylobacterium sp. J-090]MCJ2081843.1 glycosyltransferase [Methylobacterium sp. J-090]
MSTPDRLTMDANFSASFREAAAEDPAQQERLDGALFFAHEGARDEAQSGAIFEVRSEPLTVRDIGIRLTNLEEVDPEFYRRQYGDLVVLPNDDALRRHYVEYGRDEGRFPNGDAMIVALEAQYGCLPGHFVPEQYRALHADLAGKATSWELQEHYLRNGRREGRSFELDLSVFEQNYERMFAAGETDAGGRRRARPAASFADLLSAARLLPGPWLNRFVLHEFGLLNAGWLPRPPTSRMEGLVLFLTMGIERLAPIALRLQFDPSFHRAQARIVHADVRAADLYRNWLSEGMPRGMPGTEAAAVMQLLGEDRFPDSFDETAYRRQLPEGVLRPGGGRFEALHHFVTTGFTMPEVEAVRQSCSPRLLEQIAEHHLNRGDALLAEIAYSRALRLAPGIGRLQHRRGDALRLLGRTDEATHAFVAAADTPGAIVWSHIHAIDGLLDRPGGVPASLDRVRRSAPNWHGSPHWRAAAHRAIARAFDLASARARNLYTAGRRREADEGLVACLDQIADLIRTVDPLPAPLPAPRNGHIVIVANRDLPQCEHYRVAQKVRQLEHGGWTVEVFAQQDAGRSRLAIDKAAAVIFYRVAAFPDVLHAILYARALGLLTIYEIDDLLFDPKLYPDSLESFEGQINPAQHVELQYGVPLFRYAMQACDVGLASTPALAEAMRPLVRSRTCHVLHNGLDERNLPFLGRPHAPFSAAALTIFYGSGTRAHNRDFTDFAAPALIDVLERHPQSRLVIVGYLHLDERFRAVAHRVLQIPFTGDVSAYWEVLSGADINLGVLAPGPFADAKSEIKWLEAAMCGIPSIVSPTRTYRELLVDGEDVLFAQTAQDWSRALRLLIAKPDLRRRIGEHARAKAIARHGPDAAVETLGRFLPPAADRSRAVFEARAGGTGRNRSGETGSLLARTASGSPSASISRPGPAPKRRILVVNVFFPPQTVGGATRVVRDNLDHILDHAADRFEVAVAATDLEGGTPYRTRVDSYRGLPVYRIAAPCEMHMDWRPFNPEMRLPFEDLLDRFAPDLVHFHSVQRLTASVAEAVQARGIPYVVTVHDAWWISDFQFLTDADGLVRPPSPDPLVDATDPDHGPTASIARRRRLNRVLDSAAAIVAVSETFADLYRRAGFPRTIAIPNGVPRLAPAVRLPNRTGRVRLGHIGGRSMHKGATLIETVLKAERFENLALTMVDQSLPSDRVIEEIWRTTPVRIIGGVPQESVGDLYAEMDVLLAPSLWPESFGLVTREAQAARLWVVASDRGAIGEAIADGVDGFRVDVGSHEGLRKALARIDADPDRFLTSPPPPARPTRMADEQGDDLIELYDRLLCRSAEPDASIEPRRFKFRFQFRRDRSIPLRLVSG